MESKQRFTSGLGDHSPASLWGREYPLLFFFPAPVPQPTPVVLVRGFFDHRCGDLANAKWPINSSTSSSLPAMNVKDTT
jgi:hypothetical protein